MTFHERDSLTKPMFNVGGGLHIHPIPFIGFTAGITYYVLEGSFDYFEPVISLGVSLGK